MQRSPKRLGACALIALSFILAGAAKAHPGSSIVVDAQGQVFFVDTGRGVWKLDAQGGLTLVHTTAYHWMALDEKGSFAKSQLGSFDRGEFERITPLASIPALIISSDYPVAVGADGGLYYVPYSREGPRQLVRRMPDGERSVVAALPTEAGAKAMRWVNGIALGPEGFLYITDNDAVRRIGRNGTVSTFREAIQPPGCSADPLPDTPKLPYLRGLVVAADGTVYTAANGCRAVIAIPAKGTIKTVLKAERPWSPTGVALYRKDIYVLEYLHTPGDNRKEWIPRVRKIAADGKVTTVAAP